VRGPHLAGRVVSRRVKREQPGPEHRHRRAIPTRRPRSSLRRDRCQNTPGSFSLPLFSSSYLWRTKRSSPTPAFGEAEPVGSIGCPLVCAGKDLAWSQSVNTSRDGSKRTLRARTRALDYPPERQTVHIRVRKEEKHAASAVVESFSARVRSSDRTKTKTNCILLLIVR
jgi:hypothetical protein